MSTRHEDFTVVLAEMQRAHEALVAERSEANFAAYAAACAKAWRVHLEMEREALLRLQRNNRHV